MMNSLKGREMEVSENALVKLPHNFVGGFNGKHWCIWECIEDYYNGLFPYEGEAVNAKGRMEFKKILTEAEASSFAKRCHKSLVKKYGKNYNIA